MCHMTMVFRVFIGYVQGLQSSKISICPEHKLSGFPHVGVHSEGDLACFPPFLPAPFSLGAQVVFLSLFAYQR